MIVGVLRVSIRIRESRSLKDKRRIVRGIKDRVRAHLNASIAEVDSQDMRQRADLGAATVSESRVHAESVLTNVVKIIDRAAGAERFDTRMEYF